MSYWFETMAWQILWKQSDPAKVMLFYCIQSVQVNRHVGLHMGLTLAIFLYLSFLLPLTHPSYTVNPFVAKSSNTPTHTSLFFFTTHIHTSFFSLLLVLNTFFTSFSHFFISFSHHYIPNSPQVLYLLITYSATVIIFPSLQLICSILSFSLP